MEEEIERLLKENDKRNAVLFAPFNPLTGEGAILEREWIEIPDFDIPRQYVPKAMLEEPFVKAVLRCGSLAKFLGASGRPEIGKEALSETLIRIRCKHDFCFWAFVFARIKNKEGGDDIPFSLNLPQRMLVSVFEEMRLAGAPIRVIVLKARQWGGSTVTQIYMSWIQLVHKTGWNSLIVGHTKDASVEVKGMFDKLIQAYPLEMMYDVGASFKDNEPKFMTEAASGNIFKIPQRNCKVKIGTAVEPNSARGGDSALVHCTEVAFWKKTEGKTPQEIVRTACSGAGLMPMTMIVYESTANGTGNFFESEYRAAKENKSTFKSLFVPWFKIERYTLPIKDREEFARNLYKNRHNEYISDRRHDSGKYLWWLWQQGATLEGIHWYCLKRAEYDEHGDMAAEYPSDDVEAFQHSGCSVFDKYKVELLKPSCRPPQLVGDVYGDGDSGKEALQHVKFEADSQGKFCVWELPEVFPDKRIANRYLTVVDVGGRSNKADFSVVVVFDRYGNSYFAHGLYDCSYRYTLDDVLDSIELSFYDKEDVYVRLILEDTKAENYQADYFRKACKRCEEKFTTIHFFGGNRKCNWTKLYIFKGDVPDSLNNQWVSSMADDARWYEKFLPFAYAWRCNKRNKENVKPKFNLFDFI